MKIYICVDHDGVWHQGCSVVVAFDVLHARTLLDAELIKIGLDPYDFIRYELTEIKTDVTKAYILDDGDE